MTPQQAAESLAERYRGEPWLISVAVDSTDKDCPCLRLLVSDLNAAYRRANILTWEEYPVLIRQPGKIATKGRRS